MDKEQKEETQKTEEFKKYFTVKGFTRRNKELGTWPDSESAIWAIRANSPANGFGEAFLTVGRRVLIDEQKFWEVINKLQSNKKNITKWNR